MIYKAKRVGAGHFIMTSKGFQDIQIVGITSGGYKGHHALIFWQQTPFDRLLPGFDYVDLGEKVTVGDTGVRTPYYQIWAISTAHRSRRHD